MKTVALLFIILAFIGLFIVLLTNTTKFGEIGIGLFVLGLAGFAFNMLIFGSNKIPRLEIHEYTSPYYNIAQMAEENNAKIENVTCNERLVYTRNKRTNETEWIYYKLDDRLIAKETEATKKKK